MSEPTGNPPNQPAEVMYNSLQTMTARANAVREGIHLLDTCYADLRVMLKYFKDANAIIPEIEEPARATMAALTAKSDNWETWLNNEQAKISATMRKLGIE
jgi:hypothetical protein